MSHEATLIYSEPLIRQAVFAFWRRSGGFSLVVAIAIVGLSLGALVAQGAAPSWLVGALAGVSSYLLLKCLCPGDQHEYQP